MSYKLEVDATEWRIDSAIVESYKSIIESGNRRSIRPTTQKPVPAGAVAKPTKTFASTEEMIKDIQKTKPSQIETRSVDLTQFDEYKSIAAPLGFDNQDISRVEFESFCWDKNIPLYNIDEVNHYMDRIIGVERKNPGKSKMIWFWRGLSKNDKSYEAETDQYEGLGERNYSYRMPDFRESSGYTKSIPLHVLRRAKIIADHFNTTSSKVVSFAVSDYGMTKPDPFMAVTYKGHQFIIGCWDEPTFGIEK